VVGLAGWCWLKMYLCSGTRQVAHNIHGRYRHSNFLNACSCALLQIAERGPLPTAAHVCAASQSSTERLLRLF
jgi:hypothetical protein